MPHNRLGKARLVSASAVQFNVTHCYADLLYGYALLFALSILLGARVRKKQFFLGTGHKQRPPPIHPYGLGPFGRLTGFQICMNKICLEWSYMPYKLDIVFFPQKV